MEPSVKIHACVELQETSTPTLNVDRLFLSVLYNHQLLLVTHALGQDILLAFTVLLHLLAFLLLLLHHR